MPTKGKGFHLILPLPESIAARSDDLVRAMEGTDEGLEEPAPALAKARTDPSARQ
jgi:hypothetical protein